MAAILTLFEADSATCGTRPGMIACWSGSCSHSCNFDPVLASIARPHPVPGAIGLF